VDVPVPVPVRAEAWVAAEGAVRAYFEGEAVREVSTSLVVSAPAIEPYIEPVREGEGWIRTSPELALKRMLAEGSGPIYEIAQVARKGEAGALHRERFVLVEWYRLGEELEPVMRDVERLVEQVRVAVASVEGLADAGARVRGEALAWEQVKLLDLMAETLGMQMPEQGDVAALERVLASVRANAPGQLDQAAPVERLRETQLDELLAWTELFSLWSDIYLNPSLHSRPEVGVHIVEFPAALAALSVVERGVAHRFESHAWSVELANGYRELRDATEQRRRFELVNGLRVHQGQDRLPLDEAFLGALEEPGLPPCCGVALGLDRLVMLACGFETLDAIAR
jgi:lysyl-tRNA synthetase class 2